MCNKTFGKLGIKGDILARQKHNKQTLHLMENCRQYIFLDIWDSQMTVITNGLDGCYMERKK